MTKLGALLFGVVGTVAALAGCSSDDADPVGTDACNFQIASTYSMTGEVQQQSASCNLTGTPQTTVTVTKASDGFDLEFTGIAGSCRATSTGVCSFQAKCNTNAGTLQLAWTFNETGFTGTNVGAITALGCTYTAKATGARL